MESPAGDGPAASAGEPATDGDAPVAPVPDEPGEAPAPDSNTTDGYAMVFTKVVSERLGHSDPAFTASVYQHPSSEHQHQAALDNTSWLEMP